MEETTDKIIKRLKQDGLNIPHKAEVYNPQETEPDRIDHPSHYTWLNEKCGIEVIDIARHLDFCLGSALKYILRAGRKSEEGYTDKEKAVEDLKKAAWYINDKIETLERER